MLRKSVGNDEGGGEDGMTGEESVVHSLPSPDFRTVLIASGISLAFPTQL
jgi:hypothetical protein